MRRRRVLASIAAGGSGLLAGCQELGPSTDFETGAPPTETPTATPSPVPSTTGSPPATDRQSPEETETATRTTFPAEEHQFETVVDMVEQVGVDASGGTPIDDALQRAAADGTLLEFPPGDYLVTEPLLLQDATNFGIRGTGENRGDVRFVHPNGHSELFLNVRGGTNSLLENFVVDQTDDRTTSTGIIFLQRDGLTIRDVEVAGFTPTEGNNPDQDGNIDLIPAVTKSGGTGTIRRFVSTGGGEAGVYPDSYPGIYSGYHHQGTLRFVDCVVENCGGAGVYTSRTRGRVQIDGGVFRNNSVAQVRVAGEGSYIRGARIVVDTAKRSAGRGTYDAIRGVWWESGDFERAGGVVANCTFVAGSAPIRRGLLEVDGTAGAMTVRDCEFRTDVDEFFAIDAFRPGSSSMGGRPARPWGVTVKNVRVTGSANGGVAVRIAGRPDSRIDALAVDQSGNRRDGVEFAQSPGSRIGRSTIDVGRYPIRIPGGMPDGGNCGLAIASDVEMRSPIEASALDGRHVDLRTGANRTCLPGVDVDGGTLVVVKHCDQQFVATVVGGPSDGTTTGTDLDCS